MHASIQRGARPQPSARVTSRGAALVPALVSAHRPGKVQPKRPGGRWGPRLAAAPGRWAAWRGLLAGLSLAGALPLAALAATPGQDEPPLPGPPRPLVVPQFEQHTLPNGVRVVLAHRPGLPLVTVALHLGLGSAADPAGQAGLASLTASLRTKGATRQGRALNASQIAQQAEALGGTLDAGAGWQGSTVSMTVLAPRLAEALALVVDTTLRPTLAADELTRLREQTADGLKFSMSDPAALAGLVARRAQWGDSVYGGSLTPASLARIQRNDVLAFHRRQARPELATLVLSGDVSSTCPQGRAALSSPPEEIKATSGGPALPCEPALALAQQALGSWPTLPMALPEPRREPPSPATPATVLVQLPGAGQSAVVVMAPSVAADSPERRVAQVAGAVLGGGYSSRINTEVRIKRGLSYGASAGNELQPVGGVLTAATQTQHATAAEVVKLLQGEITRLAEDPPTADELAARQATLVGSFGRQLETTAGLAQVAIDQIARGRPLEELQRLAPEVLAVTPTQVQAFAARHWTAGRLRTVVVGDLAAAGAGLRSLDPEALVLDAVQLDLNAATLQPGRRR